jgi:hypothetical protein
MSAPEHAHIDDPAGEPMTTPYYHPSGRVPATAVPVAVLVSTGLIPFAWIYAWLTIHAPLVFNFFIAFAFSFAIGWLTKLLAGRGKVRNALWMSRAGVVLGVMGWYLQWAAWAALTMGALDRQAVGSSIAGTFFVFVTHPLALIRLVIDIAPIGTNTISGWSLKGGWLIAVWLVELWMHLMLPPLMGRMRADEPFCELTNAWAKKCVLARKFAPLETAAASLLEADPGRIRTMLKPTAEGDSSDYAEVILYRSGGPDAFLSVINVSVTEKKSGHVEKKPDAVVEFLRLPDTNVEELMGHLMADTLSAADRVDDTGRPIAPALANALAHLESNQPAQALDAASAHVLSTDVNLRADANRICALACSALGRWAEAADFFTALFNDEPGAHSALQVATSSVMAGRLPVGITWVGQAQALNAVSREVPQMLLLTSFVTALKQSGHENAAMPFVDQIRQAYTDLGSTDPTVLYARSMPFFGAFLSNSVQFVRACLAPEQGRRWYAAMLPSLDSAGKAELAEWLDNEFGPAAGSP